MDLHIAENAELLIAAIRSRPVIWDKSLSDHKDRAKVRAAWTQVCTELKEDFQQMTDGDKMTFRSQALKRWTNIRDSYLKKQKLLKKTGTGSKSDTPSKYIFCEQLRFLDKILEENKNSHIPPPPDIDETSEENSEFPITNIISLANPNKKVKTSEEVGERLLPALKECDNHHLYFFKGLLPSIADFNAGETLDLQAGVINVIRSIRSMRTNRTSYQEPVQIIPDSPSHQHQQFLPHSQPAMQQYRSQPIKTEFAGSPQHSLSHTIVLQATSSELSD